MASGTVKFFNSEKGFGFLSRDDGGDDMFVHVTAVDDAGLPELKKGDRVVFDIGTNKKNGKPKAVNLRLLTGAESA